MDIALDTPQRVAIIVEKNKSDTWSLAAYLVTADGWRERRCLGIYEDYGDATNSLKRAWEQAGA